MLILITAVGSGYIEKRHFNDRFVCVLDDLMTLADVIYATRKLARRCEDFYACIRYAYECLSTAFRLTIIRLINLVNITASVV